MLKFKLVINCENDAFQGDSSEMELEVARILKRITQDLYAIGEQPYQLRDINGNVVGHAEFVRE